MKLLLKILLVLLLDIKLFSQQKSISITSNDSLSIQKILASINSKSQNEELQIQLAEKALNLSQKINYQKGIALSQFAIAKIFQSNKKLNKAIEYFAKAKEGFSDQKDDFHLGQIHKNLGDIYSQQSMFRHSFENYRDAQNYLRNSSQLKLLNECQDALGNIALEFGQSRNAIPHFKRSLLIKSKLKDTEGIIKTNQKISKIFIQQKQYDSASYYIHEVKKISKNTPIYYEAMVDEFIVHSFQRNFTEAEKTQKIIYNYLQENNDETLKIRFLAANSNFYLAKKDKETANKYFAQAAELIEKARNPELAITGLGFLAEMSEQNDDFKTAFRMQKQMDKFKDIFRNENIDRISAEIKNIAEASLKEKEIEFLNQKNELANEKLKQEELLKLSLKLENQLVNASLKNQQQLIVLKTNEANLNKIQLAKEKELNLSLARENNLKRRLLNDEQTKKKLLWSSLGILTLATGLIFWQYKNQLTKTNIIKKQSAELGILNKEIHHRVKNNLQIISSLLDLQSQSLTGQKSKTIIKEGIQRVQSMAFIHQNLYEGEAANSVNINEYLKMLSTHLFQTYNIKKDKIKFHTQIEGLKLHTDTAIPIGMIMNELISNSLKYAFKGRETGDIWVNMIKKGNKILLQVKDNGIGMAKDFDQTKSKTFGYEIITAFLQKLKARMNIEVENGTNVEIIISKFKIG